MTSLKRSGKAGPEETGNLSPANQVEAKEEPEACQRGREPQRCGTSCTGEARRPSAVQISEKLPRIVPASVRREADRVQNPSWMRVPRLATAEHWYRKPSSRRTAPLGGVELEVEVKKE